MSALAHACGLHPTPAEITFGGVCALWLTAPFTAFPFLSALYSTAATTVWQPWAEATVAQLAHSPAWTAFRWLTHDSVLAKWLLRTVFFAGALRWRLGGPRAVAWLEHVCTQLL